MVVGGCQEVHQEMILRSKTGTGEQLGRKKVPGKGAVVLVPATDTTRDLLRTHGQRTSALKA